VQARRDAANNAALAARRAAAVRDASDMLALTLTLTLILTLTLLLTLTLTLTLALALTLTLTLTLTRCETPPICVPRRRCTTRSGCCKPKASTPPRQL